MDIEAIKMDRKIGTPGKWTWRCNDGPQWNLGPGILLVEGGMTDGTPDGDSIDRANARRIARVPELETAVIALQARVDELESLLAEKKP